MTALPRTAARTDRERTIRAAWLIGLGLLLLILPRLIYPVLALDILDMPPLAGVEFLHGDFREEAVLSQFEAMLGDQPVDLVLSDMAPNKSGVGAVDQPRMMHLAELALDFADNHLKTGGAFLIKLFQGEGFDDYVRDMRRRYDKVSIRKPEASRKRSPEVYALGQGKRAHMK